MTAHLPLIVNALLAAAAAFLFLLGAACVIALFKGAAELRRLLHAASSDYSSVLLKSALVPGVSVPVVVHDASAESRALLRRLLDLHFGKHEVLLVLSGLSDAGRAEWVRELRLVPVRHTAQGTLPAAAVRSCWVSREPLKVLALDTAPGPEAAACNAAINAAQYPVLGFVDPRAEFVPEWLLHLMRPLLEHWHTTAAVCATAMPPPREGLAGRIGTIELLRRWLVRGAAFARWRKLLPMPGACLLVKRETVVAAGGLHRGLMELFLELHARREQIAFLPSPVSWTRAPASFADLHEQIVYDQAQLAAGLRHRAARSGGEFTGLFAVRVIRPLVETLALLLAAAGLVLGWVPPALAILVALASVGVGLVVSASTLVLAELADPGAREPRRLIGLFLTAIPENLGYRQLRNLWLIAGFLR